MRYYHGKKFAIAVKVCKMFFPLKRRVFIKTLALNNDFGDCVCDKPNNRWLIRVEKYTMAEVAIDTLIHEWAHAYRDENYKQVSEHHDDKWGIIYSRIHRTYHASRDKIAASMESN